MATFLASDIAKRVQLGGQDPVGVLNRIRNWTKAGLLAPSGDAHPGGGRAILYSEDALLSAALLQKITAAGIDAVDAAEALKEAKDYLAKDKSHGDFFLLLSRPHDQFKWRVGQSSPAGLGRFIKIHFPNETFVVVYVRDWLKGLGLEGEDK